MCAGGRCREWLVRLGHRLDKEPLGHMWEGLKDPSAKGKPSCVTRGRGLHLLPHSTSSCRCSPHP